MNPTVSAVIVAMGRTPRDSAFRLLLPALLTALLTTAPVAAQTQPAITPGGALPQLTPLPQPGSTPAPAVPPADAPEPETADDDTAPRMDVRGFRIVGIIDRPDLDIQRGRIEQIAARSLEIHKGSYGIRQFRQLTQAITQYYRQRGLFLARAYIPEQTINDGVVEIRVIEGLLESVQPIDNKLYADERLTGAFGPWIDQPVHERTIEREMLILNDLPGLSVTGVFRPGETLGTTTLLLDVQRERPFEAYASYDNYGTELTGENRALFGFRWNNPTGAADQFRGALLQTLQPANNTYWNLGYSRPIINPEYRLDFSYTTNSFTVGQLLEQLDITGESTIYGASLRRDFIISRERRLFGIVDFSRKSARSSQSVTDIGKDELSVLSASGQYEFRDDFIRGSNLLRASLSLGLPGILGAMDEEGDGLSSRIGGSGERAGGDFTKLVLNYSRLQGLPEIPLFRNQELLLRVQAQFSGDLLTSLEQMPLGGPYSVRAYPSSEVLADSATLISLEWLARTAAGSTSGFFNNLRLSAFFDYASGSINDALPNETDSVSLTGVGMGLRFTPRPRLEAKVEFATAIGNPEPSNGGGLHTLFNLLYTF